MIFDLECLIFETQLLQLLNDDTDVPLCANNHVVSLKQLNFILEEVMLVLRWKILYRLLMLDLDGQEILCVSLTNEADLFINENLQQLISYVSIIVNENEMHNVIVKLINLICTIFLK